MRKQGLIKYFIFQEVSTFCIILGLFFNKLLLLGICFKLALFPFHTWILSLIFYFNKFQLIWLWTASKFIPLLFIFSFNKKHFLFVFLLLFIFSQLSITFISLKINFLIFFRSILNTFWIIILNFFSFLASLIFFIFYYILLLFITMVVKKWNFFSFNKIFIFQFSGIPFRIFFFLKVITLIFLIKYLYFYSILLIVSTLFIFFSYFKSIERIILKQRHFWRNLPSFKEIIRFLYLDLIFLILLHFCFYYLKIFKLIFK